MVVRKEGGEKGAVVRDERVIFRKLSILFRRKDLGVCWEFSKVLRVPDQRTIPNHEFIVR